MRTLAAKVAPQRSTQYSALASALAGPELRLSPIAPAITALRSTRLAGQPYLLVDLEGALTEAQESALWQMGATSEFFWYHESIGDQSGPFLEPLTPRGAPLLRAELVEARRYKGKTNELFAQVLINVTRWAHPGPPACLLDPLMGGGTFVFIALQLGLNALGIEQQRTAVESTDTFLSGFLKEERIRTRRETERLTNGRRTFYTLSPRGVEPPLRAVLVHGETAEAPRLLAHLPRALRPDLVVADLPYGIQHPAQLQSMLATALPAWHAVALEGAVLGLAWDATRIPRATFIEWVEEGGLWQAEQGGAWEELAHAVDRVIKRRDVLVARRCGEA